VTAEREKRDPQRIETPEYACWMGDNGIVRFSLSPDTIVDLDFAQQVKTSIQELMRDRPRPLLVWLDGAKSMTRGAREHLAGMEGPSAVGLVVNSPIARAIGGMFVGLSKHFLYPLKMFAVEKDAVEWLVEFAEQNAGDGET
jgi:hypothetical protein